MRFVYTWQTLDEDELRAIQKILTVFAVELDD